MKKIIILLALIVGVSKNISCAIEQDIDESSFKKEFKNDQGFVRFMKVWREIIKKGRFVGSIMNSEPNQSRHQTDGELILAFKNKIPIYLWTPLGEVMLVFGLGVDWAWVGKELHNRLTLEEYVYVVDNDSKTNYTLYKILKIDQISV